MHYNSHYSTRSNGCAPKTERVTQVSSKKYSDLAKSIALVLFAIPITSQAATLKGVKFQNMDANPKFTSGVDKPYVNHQIIIRNQATGQVLSATTDKNGAYTITDIPIGADYTVNVSFPDGLCLVTAVPPVTFTSATDEREMNFGYGACAQALKNACDEPTHFTKKTGAWNDPTTWAGGKVPTAGDRVRIQPNHVVTVTGEINLVDGGLCNQGTLQSDSGATAACRQPSTPGKDIVIFAREVSNGSKDAAGNPKYEGAIISGSGGSSPYDNSANPCDYGKVIAQCGDWSPATAGKGGNVEIYATKITNIGKIESGKGGDASAAHASAVAGDGGLIKLIADATVSENTRPLISGAGGKTCGNSSWWNIKPGKGGDVVAQFASLGDIWKGTSGTNLYWDPTKLKAEKGLSISGYSTLEIYTDEGGEIDFTALSEGAISVETLRIQTKSLDGVGGSIDLRGLSGKVFKATQKVEIYADSIQTDAGVNVRDLIDSPEISINPGRLASFVNLTGTSLVGGEPESVVDVPIRVNNIGTTPDIYSFEVTSASGWVLGTLDDVMLNGLEVKTVNLPVTLPAQRGLVDNIKIVATSQLDPSVKHEINLILQVNPGDDSDGDTQPDNLDAFPTDPKEWLDSDKDGIGNNADPDDDNDGMTDEWEVIYPNALSPALNDAAEDFDKDGFTNLDEFKAGTDPTDPASKPTKDPEKVALTVSKAGEGTVTAEGIDCGEDCTESYTVNTEVKLTATPAEGYELGSWSGDCATDTVTMDAAKNCTATFNKKVVVVDPPVEIGKYTAHGALKDNAGNPLAGILVQIADKTVTTDAAGNWKVEGLNEGEYTVKGALDNFACLAEVGLGNEMYQQEVVCKQISSLKVTAKSTPATAMYQGGKLSYLITATNGSTKTATGVVLNNLNLPQGVEVLGLKPLDGGECDVATVSCTLPDLAPGTSARVELELGNVAAGQFHHNISLSAADFPTDQIATWKSVKPYLSTSVACTPNPVVMLSELHCTATAELSSFAPTPTATGVKLQFTPSQGTELKAASTNHGQCEVQDGKAICSLNDLSIVDATQISKATVELDLKLVDAGLLVLTSEAKLTATNYAEHTAKGRTNIMIPKDFKADLVLAIDTTYSMNKFINGVIKGLEQFIETYMKDKDPATAPLTVLIEFKDNVRIVTPPTRDINAVLTALRNLKVGGGGMCPEASVEAFNLGADYLTENGVISIVTNAPPYPDANVDALKQRVTDMTGKGAKVFILYEPECDVLSEVNQDANLEGVGTDSLPTTP